MHATSIPPHAEGGPPPVPRSYTARQRAALPGSAYDRLIGLLKFVLPVLSFILLMALVILPLTSRQEFSFLLDKDKVTASADRLRLENAQYRGENDKGETFMIRARSAVQRDVDDTTVDLLGLRAELGRADGVVTAVAQAGQYDVESKILTIAAPARITSADDYRLDTGRVMVNFVDRTVESGERVTGRIPLGTFRANRFSADVEGGRVVLAGGTHLHIVPGAGH